MYDGIINVYKEKGFTSFDVVAKMRGILGQKKVGHTGTLDPEAEGVLPVCVGKGTRLCDMLTDRDKTYEATLLLGMGDRYPGYHRDGPFRNGRFRTDGGGRAGRPSYALWGIMTRSLPCTRP